MKLCDNCSTVLPSENTQYELDEDGDVKDTKVVSTNYCPTCGEER